MVCQVVVAVCVVLGFISHQTSAQWGGQPQTQMGGFGQTQAQMGGLGQSQAQMGGMGQSPAQMGGWGQSPAQMGGMGQAQMGGWGQSPAQMGGMGQSQAQMGGWGQSPSQMGGLGQSQAQTGGWGQSISPALGRGNWFQQQDETQYLTCIAVNEHNDDMRVTFTLGTTNNNPWGRMGMFGNRFGNARSLRLSARITSGGPTSTLQGRFRLAVTEFSRSEEVCLSRALGDILTENTWWGQSSTPRGLIGTEVSIKQGQVYNSNEAIDNLEFNDLVGHGMLLCPSNQIRDSTCMNPIPLCCKLGYDTQPATMPFAQQGQFLPQGMQTPGFGTGFNQGMGGLSQGMGGGLNPGMGGGLNNGMNGQGMGGGMGGQGMGVMAQGSQPGMTGQNNAGQPNLAGIPFRK